MPLLPAAPLSWLPWKVQPGSVNASHEAAGSLNLQNYWEYAWCGLDMNKLQIDMTNRIHANQAKQHA